jgi:DNA-binding MarR family transcriptional regulator
MRSSPLTDLQSRVLEFIRAHPDSTTGDIGRALQMKATDVSQVIGGLIARDLVRSQLVQPHQRIVRRWHAIAGGAGTD